MRGDLGSKATYEHNCFAVLNLLVSCFRTNVLLSPTVKLFWSALKSLDSRVDDGNIVR